jgi:PAS domain S-box-containing protein
VDALASLAGLIGQRGERMGAEERLKQCEVLFRMAFAGASVGVTIKDRNGRFVSMNPAYCRITGYSAEELRTLNLKKLIHPEDLEQNLPEMRQYLAGKRSSGIREKRYVTKSGATIWVQNSLSMICGEDQSVFGSIMLTEDVTSRKRAEAELQQLSGRLLELQDQERRRIARDLHDSTGQDLVALSTSLVQLRSEIPSSYRRLRKIALQCQSLAEGCTREVRTLSYLMHPPILDEYGLMDAIRNYVRGFTKRTGIQIELEVSPRLGTIAKDVEVVLFRIVQESLTNIQRHSGSSEATIRIQHNSNRVTLEIMDRGRGIPTEKKHKNGVQMGVGIASMQERLKQIGGQLEVDSGGDGTTVRVRLRLP